MRSSLKTLILSYHFYMIFLITLLTRLIVNVSVANADAESQKAGEC